MLWRVMRLVEAVGTCLTYGKFSHAGIAELDRLVYAIGLQQMRLRVCEGTYASLYVRAQSYLRTRRGRGVQSRTASGATRAGQDDTQEELGGYSNPSLADACWRRAQLDRSISSHDLDRQSSCGADHPGPVSTLEHPADGGRASGRLC